MMPTGLMAFFVRDFCRIQLCIVLHCPVLLGKMGNGRFYQIIAQHYPAFTEQLAAQGSMNRKPLPSAGPR